MSLSQVIAGMSTALSSTYYNIEQMGGAIPSSQTLNNLPTALNTIPTGGGNVLDKILDRTISAINDDYASSIASYVFYRCSNLTSVNFPACTAIDGYAFANCTSLTSVSFPACTIIYNNAFQSCTILTSISFPVCTSIGISAFANCTSLTSINSPACTSISTGAFINCTNLTSVSLSVCTSIGSYAFRYCYSLTSVSFPVCTTIDNYAIQYCNKLTSVSFPVCTTIGGYAFANCTSLTSVSFPACTSIGTFAFSSCTSLESIYIGTSNCSITYTNVFSGTKITTTTGSIFVPTAYVDTYKAATNWTYFSNRIFGYDPTPVSLSVSGNWTNTQYTNNSVDITGLTFTVTYDDGGTAIVTPTSISPSTWSNTIGTQTATFSYTANGVTVSCTKTANVEESIGYTVTFPSISPCLIGINGNTPVDSSTYSESTINTVRTIDVSRDQSIINTARITATSVFNYTYILNSTPPQEVSGSGNQLILNQLVYSVELITITIHESTTFTQFSIQ